MTGLFQSNFKIQVHVHTDSDTDSLGFLPSPSVPFHLCFEISFFFMLLTLPEWSPLNLEASFTLHKSMNLYLQDSSFSRPQDLLDTVSLGCPEAMSKTKLIPPCLIQLKAVCYWTAVLFNLRLSTSLLPSLPWKVHAWYVFVKPIKITVASR